jgi:hypothetical protein
MFQEHAHSCALQRGKFLSTLSLSLAPGHKLGSTPGVAAYTVVMYSAVVPVLN